MRTDSRRTSADHTASSTRSAEVRSCGLIASRSASSRMGSSTAAGNTPPSTSPMTNTCRRPLKPASCRVETWSAPGRARSRPMASDSTPARTSASADGRSHPREPRAFTRSVKADSMATRACASSALARLTLFVTKARAAAAMPPSGTSPPADPGSGIEASTPPIQAASIRVCAPLRAFHARSSSLASPSAARAS